MSNEQRPHRGLVRRCALLLAGAAAALLAACGGGGGGAGDVPGPGPAVTLTADFYPLAAADRRSWRQTAGDGSGTITNERVFPLTQVDGRNVYPVDDDGGDTTYLELTGNALQQVPVPGGDPLLAAIGPIPVLRLGLAAGQTEVTLDRSTNVDIDGSGHPVPVDLHLETSFVGLETVTTAAGSFVDAAHVRTLLRTTVHPTGSPAVTITFTSDDWYARGIGPVKNVANVSAPTGTSSATSEVFAWGVGGRHSESVAPSLVSASPADGGSLAPQGSLTLNFSEAIDPLSLDGSSGIGLFDAAGGAVSVNRVAANGGAQWTLTPTAALADGRYTWHVGTGVTDLAGNAVAASGGAFVVDTTGPRLAGSQPAADSSSAPLTGQVWLKFDEAVFAVPGSAPKLTVTDSISQATQILDASVQGDTLVATLATPLTRNRQYTLALFGLLADAGGNLVAGGIGVSFRTDPGPLSRPQATDAAAAALPMLKVADLDRDGRPDLLMVVQYQGNPSPALVVRKGQATGGLGAPIDLLNLGNLAGGTLCLYSPIAMQVLDADGDGRPDVLLVCTGGGYLLRQAADGSFSGEVLPGGYGFGLFPVDPDGSGRGDFVSIVANGSGYQARLLARSADGSWATQRCVDIGDRVPMWLRYADLDGDGRRDLVWLRGDAAGTGYELASRLTAGDGSPGPIQSVALDLAYRAGFELADVDGDGVPEVLASELSTDPSTGLQVGRLRLWKRTPAGGYAAWQSPAATPGASSVVVGDLDGDGRADVIVAQDASFRVSVFLQGSDGLLQAERLFESSYGYAQPLAVMDVDGDGRADLIDGTAVLLGQPFTGAWPAGAPAGAQALRSRGGVRRALGSARSLGTAIGGAR